MNNQYPPLNPGCQCITCLGCQQMENPKFRGKYDCDKYVDGRSKEKLIDKDKYYSF